MGVKSIKTARWLRFLKSLGLDHIRSRGDHDYYDNIKNPLSRPISVIGKLKDVPITHIHTSLKTLGINKTDFQKQIKNF